MARPAIAKAVKAQSRIAVGKAHGFQMGVGPAKPAKPAYGVAPAKPLPGGKPVAPPSAYTPTPWDSAYEQSMGNARTKYNNALIGLGLNKTSAEQDFGLAPNYNDYTTNPYSRAALLEQSFQRGTRGTINSAAARGQLYAGSTQNAEGYNRQSNAQNKDALERSYRDALQGISDKELGAGDEKRGEEGDALWKKTEGASKADLEPETAPEGKKKGKGKKGTYKKTHGNSRRRK